MRFMTFRFDDYMCFLGVFGSDCRWRRIYYLGAYWSK